MIDLPKKIRAAKTFKTFVTYLGAYCLSHFKRDPGVVRHMLQVFIEVSRIYGIQDPSLEKKLSSAKIAQGKFAGYYRFQLIVFDDRLIQYIWWMSRAYRDTEHTSHSIEQLKSHPHSTAKNFIYSLFVYEHENMPLNAVMSAVVKALIAYVDAMTFYDHAASNYDWNIEDGNPHPTTHRDVKDINDDLVLIKMAVIMETDVHFLRGAL